MTDARRATLYRELAELDERRARVLRRLADAYDAGSAEVPPPAPSETRRRRPRRVAPLPGPVTPPTDVDRAKAREASRRLGHLVRG